MRTDYDKVPESRFDDRGPCSTLFTVCETACVVIPGSHGDGPGTTVTSNPCTRLLCLLFSPIVMAFGLVALILLPLVVLLTLPLRMLCRGIGCGGGMAELQWDRMWVAVGMLVYPLTAISAFLTCSDPFRLWCSSRL